MPANAASFTIAAESANAHNVAVQLGSVETRGEAAQNSKSKQVVDMYLSSDSAGDTILNPVTSDVVPTAGAAGKLVDKAITGTKPSFKMKTDATGKVNVVLTNAADAAITVYLNVILASGKVVTSAPIAFIVG